jgi:hypothetical protein
MRSPGRDFNLGHAPVAWVSEVLLYDAEGPRLE